MYEVLEFNLILKSTTTKPLAGVRDIGSKHNKCRIYNVHKYNGLSLSMPETWALMMCAVQSRFVHLEIITCRTQCRWCVPNAKMQPFIPSIFTIPADKSPGWEISAEFMIIRHISPTFSYTSLRDLPETDQEWPFRQFLVSLWITSFSFSKFVRCGHVPTVSNLCKVLDHFNCPRSSWKSFWPAQNIFYRSISMKRGLRLLV